MSEKTHWQRELQRLEEQARHKSLDLKSSRNTPTAKEVEVWRNRPQPDKALFKPLLLDRKTVEEHPELIEIEEEAEGTGKATPLNQPKIIGDMWQPHVHPDDDADKLKVGRVMSNIIDAFADGWPELAKAIRLPRYQQPGDYPPYRWFEAGVIGSIVGVMGKFLTIDQGEKLTPDVTAPYYCAMNAYKHHWPLYWVSKDLVDAIIHTDPPADLRLEDIHWPLPAMTFFLPKGVMFGKEQLISITISHGMPDTQIVMGDSVFEKNGLPNIYFPDHFISMWGMTVNHEAIEKDDPLSLIGTWFMNDAYTGNLVEFIDNRERLFGPDLKFMARMVFNLILIMQTRPEFVDPKRLMKSIKSKRTGDKEPIYDTRWIGKRYKIVREKSNLGGTHSSPHAHWRQGHWRNQAIGPRVEKQHKRLWIEPIWVDPQ